MDSRSRRLAMALGLAAAIGATTSLSAVAAQLGPWATAVSAESLPGTSTALNTSSNDGCPIESPDGLRLYVASNRPGGYGGIDIWVAKRATTNGPFGAPVNLGPRINSAADDFCPTPVPGRGLYFVSSRGGPGSCGGPDIYFSRLQKKRGWTTPRNLGCQVNGPLGEAGPSYFEADGVGQLYYSSGPDIFVSRKRADGTFGPRAAVAELNSPSTDLRPNVRKDGLEVVFDSDRSGTVGGADLWIATRSRTGDPWSSPVNVGTAVNSTANETRGSFSRDALTLYFGRAPGPEGGSDIFVTTREKLTGE